MAQAMAELATVPYLQRVSQEDDKLVSLDFQHLFWPLQAERERAGRARAEFCAVAMCSGSQSTFFQCGDLKEFSNPPAVL